MQDAVKPAKATAGTAATTRSVAAKGVDQAPVAQAVPAAAARPVVSQAPRTRSQTKGLSMTSMLQTRSEAAVSVGRRLTLQSPIPDIDAIDRCNPLAMTAYVNDIHSFYKRIEPKYRVEPNYMRKQVQKGRRGSCISMPGGSNCIVGVI